LVIILAKLLNILILMNFIEQKYFLEPPQPPPREPNLQADEPIELANPISTFSRLARHRYQMRQTDSFEQM
jgi:hypothetical protein